MSNKMETDNKTPRPGDASQTALSLDAFNSIVDICGGDKTRWPPDKRAAMEYLLGQEPAARKRLAQLQALEQVLSQAGVCTPPHVAAGSPGTALGKTVSLRAQSALVDQIVEAALGPDAAAPPTAKHKRGGVQTGIPIRSPDLPPPAVAANNNSWRSATLLAASLVIGIFIGASTPNVLPVQVLSELKALASGQLLSDTWQDVAELDEVEFNEFNEEAL